MQAEGGVEEVAAKRRFFAREATRKWLREFASIVLGVLVALTLGAAASNLGWVLEVRGAREAMAGELGELIGQSEERLKIDACVERRLDALATIIDDAARVGRLPALGEPAAPPYRTWPTGVWQSTLSAQTAAHLDRETLDNYSTAYDFAAQLSFHTHRELDVWTRLYALAGPGRPFGAEEAGALRSAIAEARLANRMMALNGVRMKQVTIAYALGYDLAEARLYSVQPRSAFAICAPMSTQVPVAYGVAPLAGVVERAIASPITRESVGLKSTR